MNSDIIWIASFDIGKKNFAFYIEETNITSLLNLDNIPKINRYNPDGTTTPSFEKLIKNICVNGKTILFKNNDLTKNCNKKSYLDPETFHNMTDLLDKYKKYWDKCQVFIIEEQMQFGTRRNTMALKLGQHCYSYFSFNYGRFKQIVEFHSYHKTQILGAQKIKNINKKGKVSYKAIDKAARKKWSIEKATQILKDRNDYITIESLTSKQKKDDLADVLCQLQAFKYLAYIDKSI
jgi:hypothetical protein